MDCFLDSKEVAVEIMDILNYVRYDLEVTTLAKITSSDGRKIRPKCFYAEKFEKREKRKHRLQEDEWPQHTATNKKARQLW
eukprot:13510502-Ditylum_brightwellii.AAC.1